MNEQEKQILNCSISEDQKESKAQIKTDKTPDFETSKKK